MLEFKTSIWLMATLECTSAFLSSLWLNIESLLSKFQCIYICMYWIDVSTIRKFVPPPACPTMLNATCRSSHFAAFTSRKNWVLWEFVANTSIKKQTKSAKCGASSGLVIHGLLPVLKSSPSNEFHQKNITIQTIYMLCMRFNCLSTFILMCTHMNAIN